MTNRLICPSEEVVAQLRDGELTADQEEAFFQHLDDCPECLQVMAMVDELALLNHFRLLEPPSAAYIRAFEQFASNLTAPPLPRKSPLKVRGPSIGSVLTGLISGLCFPLLRSKSPALASFGSDGHDPNLGYAPHIESNEAQVLRDAIERTPPIEYKLDDNSLELAFADVKSLDHFVAQLPKCLAERASIDGHRLAFHADAASTYAADNNNVSTPVRNEGLADSKESGMRGPRLPFVAASPNHQDHRGMAGTSHSLAPIENAPQVIGMSSGGETSESVHQHYSDTCAVRCQQLVLHQYGVDLSEEALMQEANQLGWYSHGRGTHGLFVGDLLLKHGIPTAKYIHANIFNLTAELAQGHKVIIGLNSKDLWKENSILEQIHHSLGRHSADHAVILSGIDTTDPDHVQVTITDPGTGDVAKAYPLAEFLSAWKDSGFFMVATQIPAPVELNPEMGNFDYHSGHLPMLGKLSFDEFKAAFGPCLDLNVGESILHDQANELIHSIEAGEHGTDNLGIGGHDDRAHVERDAIDFAHEGDWRYGDGMHDRADESTAHSSHPELPDASSQSDVQLYDNHTQTLPADQCESTNPPDDHHASTESFPDEYETESGFAPDH